MNTIENRKPILNPRAWWSLGISLLAMSLYLILGFVSLGFGENVLAAIISAIFVFAFVGDLFFEESAVRTVIVYMAEKSINFPGLIWEFSLDGFIWLIAMKALFAVVGFIFGVLCAIVGVIVAVIISPIAYPINLITYIREG